jgi:UDP-N-acetylglucosamine 2-epimerase (non-hydrolysing)
MLDEPMDSNLGVDVARRVLVLFGTRPETIKLAPVVWELNERRRSIKSIVVTSAQHTNLLHPFVRDFSLRVDHNLEVMTAGQTLSDVCARVLARLDPLLAAEQPDLVLVQGDTTTAMAGALAAFHRKIPVGHVEAGLRSGNRLSPFPEEVNRRIITQLGTLHFAATLNNTATLTREGVAEGDVYLTGNPVVDALKWVLSSGAPSDAIASLLQDLDGRRVILLTTHRRESFGAVMQENLRVLRDFVERHKDVSLVFPVHPNPEVRAPTNQILAGQDRIHLLEPLCYFDFIHLLSRAWLAVSDSGGVQEEAPSLGVPLLVIRENTERPEALETGVARLVGGSPARLATMLEEVYTDDAWIRQVKRTQNPFGNGDARVRIVDAIERFFDKRS